MGFLKNLSNATKELEIYSSSSAADEDVAASVPSIAEPFVLAPGSSQEVTLRLRPTKTGKRTVRVNVVERRVLYDGTTTTTGSDADSNRRLFRAWLIHLDVQPAIVTKVFELRIPVASITGPSPASGNNNDNDNNSKRNKCVHYTNPYATTKTFSLSTDRPDLLTFREPAMRYAAGETRIVGLRFSAAPNRLRAAYLLNIFVNDESDKNEETFAVRVMYT